MLDAWSTYVWVLASCFHRLASWFHLHQALYESYPGRHRSIAATFRNLAVKELSVRCETVRKHVLFCRTRNEPWLNSAHQSDSLHTYLIGHLYKSKSPRYCLAAKWSSSFIQSTHDPPVSTFQSNEACDPSNGERCYAHSYESWSITRWRWTLICSDFQSASWLLHRNSYPLDCL